MDSSVSPKDEICSLPMCHHISNVVYHRNIVKNEQFFKHKPASKMFNYPLWRCFIYVGTLYPLHRFSVSRNVENYLNIEVKVAEKAIVHCKQVPPRCSQGSTKAIYGRYQSDRPKAWISIAKFPNARNLEFVCSWIRWRNPQEYSETIKRYYAEILIWIIISHFAVTVQ